jgi:hypothetical protein
MNENGQLRSRRAQHQLLVQVRARAEPVGRSWAPAVDGIRNFTGRVNRDGTVTLYGVTTSIGGVSDYGANPNKLVTITDSEAATSLPANERFSTLRTAAAGDVYRGVSFAPRADRW